MINKWGKTQCFLPSCWGAFFCTAGFCTSTLFPPDFKLKTTRFSNIIYPRACGITNYLSFSYTNLEWRGNIIQGLDGDFVVHPPYKSGDVKGNTEDAVARIKKVVGLNSKLLFLVFVPNLSIT